MEGAGIVKDWIFFLLGCLIALAFCLLLGVAAPVLLIPIMINWALIPFIVGGGVILLIYYFLVVFGMSWMYEQFTRYKPDYWVSSFYLFSIAVGFYLILYFKHGIINEDPFSYWYYTKGAIMICCMIPAWIRIIGVTLIGAFYSKIK